MRDLPNPLEHPVCLEEPKRLTGESAWVEHIPFGMYLVDLLEPNVLVELGTHAGDSYCAFCQAVNQENLDTRCYAIDTWEGDPHTGFYGPEILQDLQKHHDPLYDKFSTLIQAKFEDALKHFEDGEIDLLHIDGYHTYESVKKNFNSWLPKMSGSGVVLFHDVNTRKSDFGVRKFWNEIKEDYPHFEFLHGHGLGLLVVGDQVSDELGLLAEADGEELLPFREFFFRLGDRITQRLRVRKSTQEIENRDQKIAALKEKVDGYESEIDQLDQSLSNKNNAFDRVNETLEELKERLDRKKKDIQALRQENLTLKEKLDKKNTKLKKYIKKSDGYEETMRKVRKKVSRKDERIEDLEIELDEIREKLSVFRARLEEMQSSLGWRVLERIRQGFLKLFPRKSLLGRFFWTVPKGISLWSNHGFSVFVREVFKKFKGGVSGEELVPPPTDGKLPDINAQYKVWREDNGLTDEDVRNMKNQQEQFSYEPKISVVTPVYNTERKCLTAAIESVKDQIYENWKLCLVDDSSEKPRVKDVLAKYEQLDERIKIKYLDENLGIAGASNHGLDMASGDYVGFLDHDDELSKNALYEVARLLNEEPELDVIYSDEDKLELNGEHVEPLFKPDWSPELLLSTNYICHFTVVAKELLDDIGGFREGYDGAQDYDLLLRITEKAQRIGHIPKILYSWRKIPGSAALSFNYKDYANESGRKAVEDAVSRREMDGEVKVQGPGKYVFDCHMTDHPQISIIIPTKDKWDLLKSLVDSIEKYTDYPEYEVIIVDNDSSEKQTLDYLNKLQDRYKVIRYPEEFNFSKINNLAVEEADGDYYLFLNNDIEIESRSWLYPMICQARKDGVGAVGPKMINFDGTIQHVGVILGMGDTAGHPFYQLPKDSLESNFYYSQLFSVTRNYSVVTGAALLIPRDVFSETGGFDPDFHVAYGDVDLCLKIRRLGYRVVYTPMTELYHHDSATRGNHIPERDRLALRRKWGAYIDEGDPYYNPNLTLKRVDLSLDL